jgi:hypothetical protein
MGVPPVLLRSDQLAGREGLFLNAGVIGRFGDSRNDLFTCRLVRTRVRYEHGNGEHPAIRPSGKGMRPISFVA